MTAEQAELLRIIRHHCQGLAGARTIDSLVAMLGVRGFKVARRWAEATIHELSLRGYPVGTGCVGATKGVFWIGDDADWKVAYENIDMRFRPLGQRRAALLNLKRRKYRPLRITDGTGTTEIEVGRDGSLERTPTDRAGHGMLFDVNIDMRFRPLGQRRRALLDLKRRKFRPLRITDGTGTAQIEVGADGQIERTPTDRAGNAMLFDVAAGQAAKA